MGERGSKAEGGTEVVGSHPGVILPQGTSGHAHFSCYNLERAEVGSVTGI